MNFIKDIFNRILVRYFQILGLLPTIHEKVTVGIQGTLECFKKELGEKKWKRILELKNLIVDLGFDYVCDAIGRGSEGIGVYTNALGIGWGTGSDTAVDAGQTDLQGEYQDRKIVTYTHTTGTKEFNIEATWGIDEPSATETITINEVGIFWTDTEGADDMFVRVVTGPVTKAPSDQILWRFTWKLSEAS